MFGRNHRLPHLKEDHFGSRARWDALFHDRERTMAQALFDRETELGRALTLAERRQFFRGWRVGLLTYNINELRGLTRYLNADELETLGGELLALAQKYGGGRTIEETEADLD